uniref:Short-chain dehydrogenase/reductase FrzI n=1 Tax=Cladobotryum sp. TaxID=2040732 RepID=FRZI_CLASX|nr:FrzI [Cladobotryum sp.]
MNPPPSLLDKAAIVTGGSRGIGAAIAIELARRGAHVLITYNTASHKAQLVAEEIQKLGRKATVVQASSTDREGPNRIVQAAVSQYGRIDIIVNNAGMADDCLLQDLTHEFWDRIMDVNLRLPAFLVQAALQHLGPAPRIVNISSLAARAGYNATSVYAASKAALEGMTRAWATELGHRYNVTVNCVNPGPVDTDIMAVDENTDAEVVAYWNAKVKETPAAPRVGTPGDIAQIVAFLCEEGSRWCTGSVVNANGGLVTV